jgi:hypothetical protein
MSGFFVLKQLIECFRTPLPVEQYNYSKLIKVLSNPRYGADIRADDPLTDSLSLGKESTKTPIKY